jgi:hypothetical protein
MVQMVNNVMRAMPVLATHSIKRRKSAAKYVNTTSLEQHGDDMVESK